MNKAVINPVDARFRWRTRWEPMIIIVSLLLLHGAFGTSTLITWFHSNVGRNPVFFSRLLVGVVTLILVASFGIRRIIAVARLDPLLLILNGYTVLSLIWSIDREETLTAVVSLVLTTLLGVYMAVRFSLEEQIRILAVAIIVGMAASVLTAILLPQIGTMSIPQHLGRWNGIFEHKNVLGYLNTLFIIVLLYVPVNILNLHRAVRIGLLVLAVAVFVFAQPLTAQLYAVASILTYPVYARWANGPKHRIPLLIGFAVIVLFASDVLITKQQPQQTVVLDRFEEDVSSDVSVSGRIHLWQASLDAIRQNPVFGYGYQAPFTPGAPVFNSLNWVGWRSAHNIVLDILLHIGVVGLLLFAVHYLMNLKNIIFIVQNTRQPSWGFCLVFMLFFVVSSLIDGNGFASRNMWWVFYVAFSVSMRAYLIHVPKTPYSEDNLDYSALV